MWKISSSCSTKLKHLIATTKGAKSADRRKMKWTKRDREIEGERENVGKELMQMQRTEKGEGRQNVNLLLTITFLAVVVKHTGAP